jgi:signal peptidase I
MSETQTAATENKPKSLKEEILEFVRTIIVFIAVALLLRASVVEAFKIPSSSMEPTLEIGDHILVNKLSYGLRLPFVTESVYSFRTPKRYDVVVFTLPEDSGTNIIKRVIGTPGDTVEVKGTQVFINGEPLKDDIYARWVLGGKKDFGPEKVPPGHVFMMGDNRDQSRDSRFWTGPDETPSPFLEISRIKGRAFIIYWNSAFKFDHLFNIIR